MAIRETVSGVGANATRTDKNLSERVSKIQREAKMQNATDGSYGQRADLTSIAGGAPTNIPAPTAQTNPIAATIQPVNAFAPGSQDLPLSYGAPGGPGAGTEALMTPVDAPDQGSILARALLAANPTSRQLAMMVEAYNELDM